MIETVSTSKRILTHAQCTVTDVCPFSFEFVSPPISMTPRGTRAWYIYPSWELIEIGNGIQSSKYTKWQNSCVHERERSACLRCLPPISCWTQLVFDRTSAWPSDSSNLCNASNPGSRPILKHFKCIVFKVVWNVFHLEGDCCKGGLWKVCLPIDRSKFELVWFSEEPFWTALYFDSYCNTLIASFNDRKVVIIYLHFA